MSQPREPLPPAEILTEVATFLRRVEWTDSNSETTAHDYAIELDAIAGAAALHREAEDKDDQGAGLIGANDTGHGDTLPRPTDEDIERAWSAVWRASNMFYNLPSRMDSELRAVLTSREWDQMKAHQRELEDASRIIFRLRPKIGSAPVVAGEASASPGRSAAPRENSQSILPAAPPERGEL